MITVRLHEDGRHVVMAIEDLAPLVVEAVAAEYAQDPHGVGNQLEEITARRHTYDSLVNIAEARDIPEHIRDAAAAALDAAREALVDTLPALDFLMNERDARLLAADLYHHAARTTTARIREGAKR